MNKKVIIGMIHSIISLVMQSDALAVLLFYHRFSTSDVIIRFAIGLVFIGLDYFLRRLIIDIGNVIINKPILLHCIDLTLIIPVMAGIIYCVFKDRFSYGISFNELFVYLGILLINTILIIERVILVKHKKMKT